MGVVQLSAEQIASIARWSCAGPGMASVELLDRELSYVHGWRTGDVVAIQGDAHVHLSRTGCVKDAVPPVEPG